MLKRLVMVVLSLSIASFLVAALHDISLPGVYYDEAIQLTSTIWMLERDRPFHGRGPTMEAMIAGKTFPVMTINYLGALKSYLFIPFYLILGVSPLSIRLGGILAGVIVILFTFLIGRRLFTPTTGLLATLLLSLDPSFVLFFRSDTGPLAVQTVLKVVSFWLLLGWLREKRFRSLGTACFLMGVGVYDKANFAFYLVALGIAFLVFRWRDAPTLLKPGNLLGGGALFCLGAAPVLIREATTGLSLLHPLLNPIVRDSSYLTDPVGLKYSFLLLTRTLNGLWIQHFITRRVAGLSWYPYLCLVSLALLPVIAIRLRGRKTHELMRIIGPLSIAALIVAEITFFPGTWGAHHYMLIYPFPHLFCAGVVGWPLTGDRRGRGRRYLMAAAFSAILIVLASNVLSLRGFYRNMEQGYFSPPWSPAISDLAGCLMNNPADRVVCVDWGLNNSLFLLSAGRLDSREIFWGAREQGEHSFRKELERLADQKGGEVVFLLYAPPFQSAEQTVESFREWIRTKEPCSFRKRVLADRRGTPVYELYSFDPAPPGDPLPENAEAPPVSPPPHLGGVK